MIIGYNPIKMSYNDDVRRRSRQVVQIHEVYSMFIKAEMFEYVNILCSKHLTLNILNP